MKIGVLAIQGAYAKHQQMLKQIGVNSTLIKHPEHLNVDGLIIPGGESTTITKVLLSEGWFEDVREYAKSHPVFGTCAGAILLSRTAGSPKVAPWNIIDMEVQRNAYGRQIASFTTHLAWAANGQTEELPATFIRAPIIGRTGADVKILSEYKGSPVLVRQGHALAATFHPELTDNSRIHRYFVKNVCEPAVNIYLSSQQ